MIGASDEADPEGRASDPKGHASENRVHFSLTRPSGSVRCASAAFETIGITGTGPVMTEEDGSHEGATGSPSKLTWCRALLAGCAGTAASRW